MSEDSIQSAVRALQRALETAGHPALAADQDLADEIKKLVRAKAATTPATPPAGAPSLDDCVIWLEAVAHKLREQKEAAQRGNDADSQTFSVFLGAGVHYGPPAYAAPEDLADYPETVRPPVGAALSEALAEGCGFTERFPRENAGDLLRVATWYEKVHGRKDKNLGLERAIRDRVQKDKRGSRMLEKVAKLPVHTFYTTNFDTLLEEELLEEHDKLWVWVYDSSPKTNDFRKCWYEASRKVTTDGSLGEYQLTRWPPAWTACQQGEMPEQPPDDRPVVFKLHGDVNIKGSLVVTDEDYIKFLRRIAKLQLPKKLLLPLGKSLLFIGYSLRDYNMRYVLSLLREERDDSWDVDGEEDTYNSYSIDLRPDPIVEEVWMNDKKWVTFIKHNLWDVVPDLERRL